MHVILPEPQLNRPNWRNTAGSVTTMRAQRWQILRTGLGLLYPVYRSIQAILTEDMEDDLIWLRYWVVLAMVTLVEMVLDPMVDFFPYYLIAKCSFLIWCMAPSPNNGVSFIFTQVN